MSLLKTEAAPLSLNAPEGQTVVADVVAAFFRSKRRILAAIIAFVILMTVLLAFGRNSYESRVVFMVRDEGSTFPSDSLGNRADSQPGSPTDTQVGTEIELLSNTDLHRQVIAALHPAYSSAAIDHELLAFDKTLQVLPIPKTSLIGVTYTAPSAKEANRTLAALSRLYLDYRSRIRGSNGAYEFFNQQANKYYDLLQSDQKQLADFSQKYQVTLMGEEKDVTVRHLADARAALFENQASLGEAQKRIQTMSSSRQGLPSRVVTQQRDLPDQQATGRLKTELVDLQNERVALLVKYHPTDRHVLEIDEKIANTSAALKQALESKDTEEQSDLNPLRQTVDADLQQATFRAAGLQARERSLSSQVGAYSAKLDELNNITGQHDDLERKLKQDETNYELYASKREGARINKTLDTDKIANVLRVSGPSLVPQSGTQVVLSAFCIYVVGILLISGVGILAGLWSPRFHSPRELEAALGAPVLATIPLLPKPAVQNEDAVPGLARVASRRGGEAGDEMSLALADAAPSQSAWPFSQLARYTAGIRSDGLQPGGAYLPLIEKLRRRNLAEPGVGSVFAFTSCNRGEGVSHFVRSLGAELTDYTGKRVAIVNALDSYESAAVDVNVAPAHSRVGTPRSGEDFLRQWFQRLREAHDYVLIDCPALSTSHAATVFGPQSDGLLLVVEAGRATRSQLRGGLAMLSLASVSVMGLALNKRRYPIPAAIYNLL